MERLGRGRVDRNGSTTPSIGSSWNSMHIFSGTFFFSKQPNSWHRSGLTLAVFLSQSITQQCKCVPFSSFHNCLFFWCFRSRSLLKSLLKRLTDRDTFIVSFSLLLIGGSKFLNETERWRGETKRNKDNISTTTKKKKKKFAFLQRSASISSGRRRSSGAINNVESSR